MSKLMKQIAFGILTVLMVTLFCGPGTAAKMVTVVATVNDNGTITDTNGVVYELIENAKGSEIADQAGSKMEIRGTVEEKGDGTRTITVDVYKVISE
jgi:hypothetical protein